VRVANRPVHAGSCSMTRSPEHLEYVAPFKISALQLFADWAGSLWMSCRNGYTCQVLERMCGMIECH
jgi:hypothetical protein